MTIIEISMLALLIVVAVETSYLVSQSRSQSSHSKRPSIYVDTSVLMDGRILPIAEAGFVPGVLVIPRTVVGELQLLADGGDSDKRERARRGLDVINELQALTRVEVRILQDGSRAREGVDERLLALAKKRGGLLCTIDFNLNKVAQVEDIEVLNINELAQKLRMSYLPGDMLRLALTTQGSDNHQAVGHLADGTMVVVEHAKSHIGKEVEVEVIRNLQTAAGRMMFARLIGAKPATTPKKPIAEARGRRKPDPKPAPTKSSTQLTQLNPKQQSAKSQPTTEHASKPQQTQAANKQQSGRQQRAMQARKSREDTLIALVNKQ